MQLSDDFGAMPGWFGNCWTIECII